MLPEGTSRMPGLGTHAEGRMPILRPRWGSRAESGIVLHEHMFAIKSNSKIIHERG